MEREREKEKKTEHPYVFISPTLEIRLGRIDAGAWSAAASLEPVLINPGIYIDRLTLTAELPNLILKYTELQFHFRLYLNFLSRFTNKGCIYAFI